MDDLIIRQAGEKDISKITNIHRRCVLEVNSKVYSTQIIKEWEEQVNEDNTKKQFNDSEWIVAEVKDQIIGFAQYSLEKSEIYQMNVAPEFIWKGVGKTLYEYIERDFLKHKVYRMSLNSTLNAVNFYERLGFKKVKDIKFKLNNESVLMIEMKKILSTWKEDV